MAQLNDKQKRDFEMQVRSPKIFRKISVLPNSSPGHQVTETYSRYEFKTNKGYTTSRGSQRIRLKLDTGADKIVGIMKKTWNLQRPDIIIFVMGGTDDHDASAQLTEMIRKDLVYAAIRANAWLITSGKNVGAAKEVGEGLRYYRDYIEKHKYNLPCIGSTSWNSIAGYAQRENKTKNLTGSASSSRRHPTHSRDRSSGEHTIQIPDNDQSVLHDDRKRKETEESNLEPNHTHFLLFDDKVKNDDFVLHLLEHFEWRWSNNNSNDEEESPIPIVVVLVESNTQLNTTKVKSVKPDILFVVLKHRECTNEIVAELHTCYSDGKIDNDVVTSTNSTISQNIISVEGSKKAKINSISNESQLKTEKINSVRNDSCEILEKCKHRVTVLKISSNMHHRNFEDAILLSLSNARRKAEKSNQQHKLANELILAIAWNRFDYAREYLLNDETRPKYTEGDLHRALLNALCHSYIDCIELLLDFGASFKNLTHDDLKRLYDQPSHNPLPIADEEEPLKKSRYYADYLKRIGFKTIHSEEKENGLPSQSAVQDLFLWAIFSNRFELAVYMYIETWQDDIDITRK
ncbi:unnamed protein product [Rotaria sordida]|uniref:TRPM SLOG domain-containing protein n=1 Tax=Rotaria sordida TaxID=392033 RepID=A0A815JMN8_9BILA|nr:unnamed protein product [Rotaria sordida]CAF1617000.1 unnamed protein product [Rotaria sordida]